MQLDGVTLSSYESKPIPPSRARYTPLLTVLIMSFDYLHSYIYCHLFVNITYMHAAHDMELCVMM